MGARVRIGTHSGTFHSDDAMACMMLTRYTQRFKDAEIVRTRDLNLLQDLDLVVDVGGQFDLDKLRFDHHQKGFEQTFD